MASICCSPPESVPPSLLLSLLEDGEMLKCLVDVLADGRLVGAGERPHLQVFEDRRAAETSSDLPATGPNRV